ncbi:Polysaccharide pyruvyl transferase [Butyrivibrio sp. ob235]|uniref:polysaccharide pyruvyl transferase family protein n=1 Tax=Butyrivibrio sp. ob235 TaxID=1761780 RepID=UPI0008AD0B1B|nr:polysaccharide pyruvyl transferase family protein [Butyrivibrio sp. ob235]SEL72930.1 Polysaccharide pyruvyl transferase [Butyrivibrio sp. ob235]
MKKAAIITIWDLWNLGNRLQNYAVTSILSKKGLQPITVIEKNITEKKWLEFLKLQIYKIIFLFSNGKNQRSMLFLRANSFKQFTKRHICFEHIHDSKELNKYDYIFIGSDQIWNAEIVCPNDFSYGQVTDKDKIICMAPSFGISAFEPSIEEIIKGYLNEIKYLNVREFTGANIIRRLAGKDVPVFVDPTLLISAEEWQILERKPKRLGNRKYILKYFLGEESIESKSESEELYKLYGYETITIMDKGNPWAFITGPAEFLYLIHHAEIILTDSFHACVFSILFKKPFWVYSRVGERMNSRLDTLFDILRIDNRFMHDMSNPFQVDYSKADDRLVDERRRFNEFIEKAIYAG